MADNLFVARSTMARLRAVRDEYVRLYPGSPWISFTSDTDIQLGFLFYGEAMIQNKIEKKKVFGEASIRPEEEGPTS